MAGFDLGRAGIARAGPIRLSQAVTQPPGGPRVVIAGASFAGISVARAVRRLVPRAGIVLIDREPFFLFAPAQLRYVFGLIPFHGVARAYTGLSARGLPVTRSAVVAIDRDRRRVVTAEGVVEYDYLVIATGIRLAHEAIPGLSEQPDANLCPYDRAALIELRRTVASFRRGHVLIATPNGPYTCPPAPYEYALMWADHVKQRGLKARVTLIDPRSRPTPPAIAEGLTRAMEVASRHPHVRAIHSGAICRSAGSHRRDGGRPVVI